MPPSPHPWFLPSASGYKKTCSERCNGGGGSTLKVCTGRISTQAPTLSLYTLTIHRRLLRAPADKGAVQSDALNSTRSLCVAVTWHRTRTRCFFLRLFPPFPWRLISTQGTAKSRFHFIYVTSATSSNLFFSLFLHLAPLSP